MCSKGCLRFVLFCLDLELFAKIKKDLVSTHSQKPGLLIMKDPNTMKKSLEPFADTGKEETCAKFQKKI